MARSDLALRRAKLAYERAHVLSALRGLVLVAALSLAAVALHRTTHITWLVAGVLAATLAAFGWRGGAWRRGSFAGVLAGLPPFIAPTVFYALTHGGHCPDCMMAPTLPCVLICFSTSAVVGTLVGYRATLDAQPRRFGIAAIASAALTGLLGCATVGLAGALGVVVGLVSGGVTGWVVAGRNAHA